MMDIKEKSRSFFKEFQSFAIKGNVIDMALGVVIGTAFSKIVSSLVADIIMPITGLIVGNVDLKDLSFVMLPKSQTHDAVVLSYGVFMQNVLDFMLVTLSIFIFIKIITTLKRKLLKEEAEQNPAPTETELTLLTEIRDLLKQQSKRP